MTSSSLDDSFHIESHAALLQQSADDVSARRALDAIIVPTIRPQSLEPAKMLARGTGCSLVVLCSTPRQVEQVLAEFESPPDDMLVTYMPESRGNKASKSHRNNLLAFLTAVHPEMDVEPSCHKDIARKRNVGLLLARLCGWRTIMYLDDDIRGMTEHAVARAADLTARFRAVGFKIDNYPDNSVVCHAHRLTGGKQDIFPGGSALLVNVEQCYSLFPPIYNEDWLFLFDAVKASSVAAAGTLSQLEYDPFGHSRRAATEEFGDVIAEGLYRLIHERTSVTDATVEYWQDVLERRSQLIDHIAEQLLRTQGEAPVIGCALMSLAAARKRLAAITSLACVSFIHAWRTDLDSWRQRLLDLPTVGELTTAAKFLELPEVESCVKQ
jgi:hypothetical protein